MKAKAPTVWELESEADLLSPQAASALVVGALITLYAIAVLLIARRAMGAFTAELPWQAVLATALMSCAIVNGLRILWRRTFPEPTALDAWIGWGSSLTLVLLAGGVSFPGRREDWVIWLPLLVADQVIRWRLFERAAPVEQIFAKPLALEGDQRQQIIRTRDAAGRETVAATLRADFVTGQRNATVYVGFCPPLASTPTITVEPIDGAALKIVQAYPHGARIDVRLAKVASEATSVSLNLVARG